MSVLFIGPEEREVLQRTLAQARANPIPWDLLKQTIPANQDTDTLDLADRNSDSPDRPRMAIISGGWSVTISVEEQPAGWFLHISISSPRHRLPHPEAVKLILEAIGLDLDNAARGWDEEFLVNARSSGRAINLLFLERERPTIRA